LSKKLKLIVLFGLITFVLTACGAKVHTETSFNKDGSGKRIIYLDIAKEDEELVDGGFSHLQDEFRKNAPKCISVNHYEDNENMRFEFVYDFNGIDELKSKTKEITGKDSDAVWEANDTIFDGSVHYQETVNTRDLIGWALKAAELNGISSAVMGEAYEDEDNITYYEGEKVHTGLDKATFTMNNAPVVEKVAVFTNYYPQKDMSKEIQISFSYEDYKSMNQEKALEYLQKFSGKFKVDSKCNGFSVVLTGMKEIKAFMEKASDKIDYSSVPIDAIGDNKSSNYYFSNELKDTVFYQIADLTEIYNFNRLFSGFQVSTKVIENYLQVPDNIKYDISEVHHTYAREATEFYHYIGDYPIEDTYYMHFGGSNSVAMKKIQAQFKIEDNFDVNQSVTFYFNKNGKEINSNLVSDYYKDISSKIKYQEKGDSVIVSFTKVYPYKDKIQKDELSEEQPDILVKAIGGFHLNKTQYEVALNFDITEYLDYVEVPVEYEVAVPSAFMVEACQVNEKAYSKEEVKDCKSGGQWKYVEKLEGTNPMNITIMFAQPNVLFYGGLILVILLVLGVASMFYFYCKKSKEVENN